MFDAPLGLANRALKEPPNKYFEKALDMEVAFSYNTLLPIQRMQVILENRIACSQAWILVCEVSSVPGHWPGNGDVVLNWRV